MKPTPTDTAAQRLAAEIVTGPLDRPLPWVLVWAPHIAFAAALALWFFTR